MARGDNGLPKVSLRPAMTYPSTPCGAGGQRSFFILLDTPLRGLASSTSESDLQHLEAGFSVEAEDRDPMEEECLICLIEASTILPTSRIANAPFTRGVWQGAMGSLKYC
jgi:hypothetical protein